MDSVTQDFVPRELIHLRWIRFRRDYSPALQARELESSAFSVRTVLIATAKTTKPPKWRLWLFYVITQDFVPRELIHLRWIRFRRDYSPALQARELESSAFSVRTVLIATAKTTKPPKWRLWLFYVITQDFVPRELIHLRWIRFRRDYSPALQAHELESSAFSVRTVLIATAKTTKPPKWRLWLFYVIPARFERATHSLEGCCSVQLSYGTELRSTSSREAFASSNLFQDAKIEKRIFLYRRWMPGSLIQENCIIDSVSS